LYEIYRLKEIEMANMSYCRMENTYFDLIDCFDSWEETESEIELEYRESILELCKRIIDCYDETDDE
jgi:hypothetical protein